MSRALLVLALSCCFAVPALAKPKPETFVTHFADVSLNKLQVMQLIDLDALVEGPSGDVALVRTGDVLGKEQAKVQAVGKGCVKVRLGRASLALCSEAPPAPRS